MSAAHRSQTNIIAGQSVDLSNCDRELVQYSSAIQPHGLLLTLRLPGAVILQASANTAAILGPWTPAVTRLHDLIGEAQAEALLAQCTADAVQNIPVHLGRLPVAAHGAFDVFAHRIDGVLVLELETARAESAEVSQLYSAVRAGVVRLQAAQSLQGFLDIAVRQVRQMTGFDRVHAFRFLPDWSGYVAAEDKTAELDSYLGLHFPASDIPAPARRVLSLLWVRHTPDMAYEPVPLEPALNPATNGPLDLSYAVLRSTSRMCNRFYLNWGVHATLILALLNEGQLWGIIVCQHRTPRHVPHEVRTVCETLTNMMALLLAAKEDAEHAAHALAARSRVDNIIERMAQETVFHLGLLDHYPNLQTVIESNGAAVVIDGAVTALGAAPADDEIRALCTWLATQEPLFHTDRLAEVCSIAGGLATNAAGLLAVRLTNPASYLLWFRSEWVHDIKWAGNPRKPVEVDTSTGEQRLSPRNSFSSWTETVRGRSRPWLSYHRDAAAQLASAVAAFQRADELQRVNQTLTSANADLESFAYTASHDLKEPVRNIHSFTRLVQRSAGPSLTPTEQSRLETISRLTERLDGLITSLLHYARTGKAALSLRSADANVILQDALETLSAQLEAEKVSIVIPEPLPEITCDPLHLTQVFQNLISNGVKYNESAAKVIEIGCRESEPPVFYVRDNGIGVAPEYHRAIFDIFRRLHGRDSYGGGHGAGLTIVRKVIERHNGQIWIESESGQGSTFCFTLAPTAAAPAPESVDIARTTSATS